MCFDFIGSVLVLVLESIPLANSTTYLFNYSTIRLTSTYFNHYPLLHSKCVYNITGYSVHTP